MWSHLSASQLARLGLQQITLHWQPRSSFAARILWNCSSSNKRAWKPRTPHLNITQHQKFSPTLLVNDNELVPIRELWAHGRGTYPACNLRNDWETSALANGKVWQGKCIVWALQRERTDGDVLLLLGQQDTWTSRLHIYIYASELETLQASALHRITCIVSSSIYRGGRMQQTAISAWMYRFTNSSMQTGQNWNGCLRSVIILIITYSKLSL